MAYGFTPTPGAPSGSSSTSASASTSAQAADQAESSSRFNGRTVAETAGSQRYIVHQGDREQSFTSFTNMLFDEGLWSNFQNNFSVYEPDNPFQFDDPYAKSRVLENEHFRQLFILINEVESIPGADPDLTVEPEEPEEQTVCNARMADGRNRTDSLFSLTAKNHLSALPNKFQNTLTLGGAGFYFSFDQEKLQCFSCGGTIEPELIRHSSNPEQLHGKFYPDCDYLRQKKGEPFIRELQDRLSHEELAMVARPIPNSRSLYSRPVSEATIHRDLMAEQRDFDLCAINEGRIPGISREEARQPVSPSDIRRHQQQRELQRQRERERHILNGERITAERINADPINDPVLNDCNAIIETLRGQWPPALLQALERLSGKVAAAYHQRGTLLQNLLEILQQLASHPAAERQTVAAEITEIIDAAEDQDCQDHTAEVLDQMKTRLLFMAVRQEFSSEPESVSLPRLFCKLKLFFNESVLYKVLARTPGRHGTPLIASRESTEIRGYLKNHLVAEVCQFPAGPIVQFYSSIGQPEPQIMDRIVDAFKGGINNQADFVQYLTDLCLTDSRFMTLLQRLDTDLPLRFAKSESNAELLMEAFDPLSAPAGSSSQTILEGAGNVPQTRDQWTREDLQMFFEEQVRLFWDAILHETSL